MADTRFVATHLTRLAWAGVRSFAWTLALLTLSGIVLAGVSYFLLRDHPGYGILAAVLAFVESVAVGVVLGGKRALLTPVAHALGSLRLGGTLARLVFERLPAEKRERLPLAQAEDWLRKAVGALANTPVEGGGLRGWVGLRVRARLLQSVEKYTLTRFREDGAREGVALNRVADEVAGRIDGALVAKVLGGLRLWTFAAAAGLVAVVLAQAYLLRALLEGR